MKIVKNITKENIKRAEQVLIDNGIESDEASNVLQAIGYTLIDTELYPETDGVKKLFRVWRFVLGCDPELTKESVDVEAETQDEAEEMVSDPYKGWGVLSSEEITDEEE